MTSIFLTVSKYQKLFSWTNIKILVLLNSYYLFIKLFVGVYEEVKAMREACGEAHLKTILATGELGNMVNVYKASLVCMMAG